MGRWVRAAWAPIRRGGGVSFARSQNSKGSGCVGFQQKWVGGFRPGDSPLSPNGGPLSESLVATLWPRGDHRLQVCRSGWQLHVLLRGAITRLRAHSGQHSVERRKGDPLRSRRRDDILQFKMPRVKIVHHFVFENSCSRCRVRVREFGFGFG